MNMPKKLEELPIDTAGNGQRMRTMTFDIADAAMLYSAMQIGANTVMMCGSGPATERMLYYKNPEDCGNKFSGIKLQERKIIC